MTRPSEHLVHALYFWLNVVFILLCVTVDSSRQRNSGSDLSSVRSKSRMDSILDSLEKSVGFYSTNIEKVNLDSVFGLRVSQGALNKAITESKLTNEQQFFSRVVHIHSKIVSLAEQGFLKLKSIDSSYFHKFEHLIDGKWFAIMPYHTADLSLVHKIILHDDASFDEASSDGCMTGLIGSQAVGIQQSCQVTDACWNLMTKKGADGYYLTHQGLFMLLAEKRGCREKIIQKAGNDEQWQELIKYFGANIYHQMVETFEKKETSNGEVGKDLFVEQMIVCQMLGVLQCFDVKFLDVVLELQDDSGCWKQASNEEDENAREVTELPSNFLEENNMIVRFQGRKLHEEIVLKDGCSAHFTGVATGCLGMFAYWFASHPDTSVSVDGKLSFVPKDPSEALQHKKKGVDAAEQVFLFARWLVIFVIVAFAFYYFRRCRRRLGPVLRKYKRLNSV